MIAIKGDPLDFVNVTVGESVIDTRGESQRIGLALVVNRDSNSLTIGDGNRINLNGPEGAVFVDGFNCVFHGAIPGKSGFETSLPSYSICDDA
jgi:hypothetical protein